MTPLWAAFLGGVIGSAVVGFVLYQAVLDIRAIVKTGTEAVTKNTQDVASSVERGIQAVVSGIRDIVALEERRR